MQNEAEFDLVVFGATPGGIVAAVRAAREGLAVLLAHEGRHIGGMITSGIGVMDTLYHGRRAPILDEFTDRVKAHYAALYGVDSEPYAACCGSGKIKLEPHVGERILEEMVAAEARITLLRERELCAVERAGRKIAAITLRPIAGGEEQRYRAAAFLDATYEGDLLAMAGAAYRVGRESRAEYGEMHAGKIYTSHGYGQFPREAADGLLNLSTFPVTSTEIFAGSTGEGDRAIQSYNFRVCLSRDPANRKYPEKPDGYDRELFLGIVRDHRSTTGLPYPFKSQLLLDDIAKHKISPVTSAMPNGKISWNEANLVGGNHDYPEADRPRRQEIARQHKELALGLLYFLQNDELVPPHVREDARQWGLALDEFADNGHFPYEMYVREARRLVGRYVFTEHDGSLAPGLGRTPMHADAIAIAEWPMDSHECRTHRQYASLGDGKFLLSEKTRPSQIPYRCLLPLDIDNLLVPVCLSCTHVGWGTLRLEPT